MSDLLNLRIIIGSLGVGGTECHLLRVLPELVKKGWTVTVITTTSRKPNDFSKALEKAGVIVKTQPRWIGFSFCPRFVRHVMHLLVVILQLIREFRHDPHSMTHFFLPEAYLIGSCAAFLANLKAPKIMSRRSLNSYQQKRPFVAWIEKKLHSKTDFILANSQAVLRQLHNEEEVPRYKLGLIYNGIDTTSFLPTQPKEKIYNMLSVPTDALIFTIIANIIPYKGHRDLIIGLGLIKKQLPDNWYLICVGRDDGIKNELIELAKQEGIDNRIIWLGSYRPVINILSITSIGILCSHEEGFSNSLLEGMAAKLPMIVTDVGGNSEAIINGKSGLVVPAKHPQLLSEAILTLVTDSNKAKQFSEAAYQRVEKVFSLSTCVESYHEFYLSLLSNTAPHFDPKLLENL